MVVYSCNNCGKEFDKKCNYNSHLNRKFQCKPNELLDLKNREIEMWKNLYQTIATTKIKSNTNYNNNNTSYIQYITNNYKDAKNLEDCVEDENVTNKMIEECKDLYLIDGAVHLIKKIFDIGEKTRPIHCTDSSRNNYICKTKGVWKMDAGGEEIKQTILPVIEKVYTQVHKKRIEENPHSFECIQNQVYDMNSLNIKKICNRALKKAKTVFLAKNNDLMLTNQM
jgi:hypothetical protein